MHLLLVLGLLGDRQSGVESNLSGVGTPVEERLDYADQLSPRPARPEVRCARHALDLHPLLNGTFFSSHGCTRDAPEALDPPCIRGSARKLIRVPVDDEDSSTRVLQESLDSVLVLGRVERCEKLPWAERVRYEYMRCARR